VWKKTICEYNSSHLCNNSSDFCQFWFSPIWALCVDHWALFCWVIFGVRLASCHPLNT
jgi:hypothetical protein